METIDIVSGALFVCCIPFLLHMYSEIQKSKREYRNALRDISRSDEVYAFRIKVLMTFGCDALESLPKYDEMVEDTKELTYKNYLNADKITNLN